MIPPGLPFSPFDGVYNPAFPVPNGGVAGTFNAFGWVREVINDVTPQYWGDMAYYANQGPGVFT